MGKNVTKKKAEQRRRRERYLRFGALALLCLLGVGILAGMAAFNSAVKPNRDMKWYVREGAVEVAAPALGEGYDGDGSETDSEFLLPEEGMRQTQAPTEAPAEVSVALPESRADADSDATDEDGEGFAWTDGADATDADVSDDIDADVVDEVEAEPEEEEIVPSGPVTLTISAAGDCTFGGDAGSKSNVRFMEYVDKYGYDYFFNGVRSIFEADDLTIINLEGPLTNETKKHSHGFVFKGDPQCVQILSGSSVELCNVANNHSQDYGVAGLKETAEVLDKAGIGYCGYTQAYQKTIKGVRVCALGFTKWDHSDEQIAKAVAAARETCDLLIVNVHWGREHVNNQNGQQIATGHAIIDAGADLVIGTHPHVLQGIEKYKGKYIVYSLGNFSFAGNANPEDKRTMIFQQSFGFVPGMGLAQAGLVDEGINIIPCSVSSTNMKNDFQPTVLPAEQGAAVIKSIVSYSDNFNVKKTLWMKDNYLLANGLIKSRNGQATLTGSQGDDAEEAAIDADDTELAAQTAEAEADAVEAAFGAEDADDEDADDGAGSSLFAPAGSADDAEDFDSDDFAGDDADGFGADDGDGVDSSLFAPPTGADGRAT